MNKKDAIEIVKEFPAALQDGIDHDGYGDTRFDKEQAKRDIEALNIAIEALNYDNTILLYEARNDLMEILSQDKRTLTNQITDDGLYYDGIYKATKIIDKYIEREERKK